MKKLISIMFSLLLAVTTSFAQYYIGYTTANVNLRECPSTECSILCKIPKHGNIFIFENQYENGFYKIIYIDKDIEGYVSAKYIVKDREIAVNDGGTLQKVGQSEDEWPTISIENACDVRTTLRLNSKTYYLEPNKTYDIISDPGQVLIIASSPGIIPYVGADVLENNSEYWWKFFVVSSKNSLPDNNGGTAYVSSTDGRAYHKISDCPYINGNGHVRSMSVQDAMNMDLKPCKHCYNINK